MSTTGQAAAMGDVETLKGLLERVRVATGPDRLLDAHLACRLIAPAGSFVTTAPITKEIRVCVGRGEFTGADLVWAGWRGRRFVTRDIDAAVAFVGEVIPDAHISLDINEAYNEHRSHTAFVRPNGEDEASAYACATPALAVCAGLLATLIAQTEGARHGE